MTEGNYWMAEEQSNSEEEEHEEAELTEEDYLTEEEQWNAEEEEHDYRLEADKVDKQHYAELAAQYKWESLKEAREEIINIFSVISHGLGIDPQFVNMIREKEQEKEKKREEEAKRRYTPGNERPMSSASRGGGSPHGGGDSDSSGDDFRSTAGFHVPAAAAPTVPAAAPTVPAAAPTVPAAAATAEKASKKRKRGEEGYTGYGTRKVVGDWLDDQPVAKVWRLTDYKKEDKELAFLKNIPPEFNNPINAKVIRPQHLDAFVYRNVTEADMDTIIKRDGKFWKKLKTHKYHKDTVLRKELGAGPAHFANMYHNHAKKFFHLDKTTNTAVVVYQGDQAYSHLTPTAELIFKEEEKPQEKKYPRPQDVVSETDTYKVWYEANIQPTLAAPTTTAPTTTSSAVPSTSAVPPVAPVASDAAITTSALHHTDQGPEEELLSSEDEDEDTYVNLGHSKHAKPLYSGNDLSVENFSFETLVQLRDDADKVEESGTNIVWQSVNDYTIVQPKAGDCYFLHFKDFNKKSNIFKHVRANGYNWFNRELEPINNEFFKKRAIYFGPEGRIPDFRRTQYFLWKEKKIIVHYSGNDDVVAARFHGNATKTSHPFVTQSSQVVETIRESALTERPMKIYESMSSKAEGGLLSFIHSARNLKQVQNIVALQRVKLNADLNTQTNLVNYTIGSTFLRQPNITHDNCHYMFLLDEDVIREVNDIIKRTTPDDPPLLLFYDTSFNAGGPGSGYVVTHCGLSHPSIRSWNPVTKAFDRPATLILSSMLHHRKFLTGHQQHLDMARSTLNLDQAKCRTIFISDNEFLGLSLWNNAEHALCWNHVKSDVWYKARSLGYR